jgi:hypothetical protein
MKENRLVEPQILPPGNQVNERKRKREDEEEIVLTPVIKTIPRPIIQQNKNPDPISEDEESEDESANIPIKDKEQNNNSKNTFFDFGWTKEWTQKLPDKDHWMVTSAANNLLWGAGIIASIYFRSYLSQLSQQSSNRIPIGSSMPYPGNNVPQYPNSSSASPNPVYNVNSFDGFRK